jgi:hypothetical protein
VQRFVPRVDRGEQPHVCRPVFAAFSQCGVWALRVFNRLLRLL